MFLNSLGDMKTMSDAEQDPRRVGRDEMNLCEFPIALLTDYPPEGIKTLARIPTLGSRHNTSGFRVSTRSSRPGFVTGSK